MSYLAFPSHVGQAIYSLPLGARMDQDCTCRVVDIGHDNAWVEWDPNCPVYPTRPKTVIEMMTGGFPWGIP